MSYVPKPAAGDRNDPAVEAAFEATPRELVAQILDGELVTMPRPRPRHARAGVRMLRALGGFDEEGGGRGGAGGWVLLYEPELHLGPRPDKVVPDLAGWRRARFPAAELDASDDAAIAVAPDWVCEILSDGTEAIDRGKKKRRIYRREGVGHLWYVDPRDRSLEIWELVDGRWVEVDTFEGEGRVHGRPFESVELNLDALWHW
jgi:Uma2 family endonuclease